MSRTSTMLLLTGDYADRLDALYAEAQRLEREAEKDRESASRRLDPKAGEGVVAQLEAARQAFMDLRAEAEAEGIHIEFDAIGRKRWRAIREKHPPRSGEGVDADTAKQDRLAGVNADSVEDDLVHAAVLQPEDVACKRDMRLQDQACSSDNPCSQRAAFDAWADDQPEGDFQAVLQRAWSMVNVARVDPKSLPASPTVNGATSGQ